MPVKKYIYALFFPLCFLLISSSCSKGYDVRFSNYYTEEMDSVVIGNNKIVITAIKPETASDYHTLAKGDYSILFIPKSKNRFSSSITVPKYASGKRTIQVDAIKQISVLEE